MTCWRRAGAWACVLWLAACAGTETGNPSFDGTLGYNTYTTNAQSVALLQSSDDAIVVDNAWLVLGDVGFVGGEGCDPSVATPVHAEGLGPGDHAPVAAVETPLTMSEGRYCGMHLPFVRAAAAADNTPEELVDHSVLIRGTLPDGRAFTVLSAFDGDLFLEAIDQDFAMDAAQSSVLVGFDVATWLGDLNWSSAAADNDNVVHVDGQNNSALLQAFESHLASGTALYRDPDGSGQVTSSSEKLAAGAQ